MSDKKSFFTLSNYFSLYNQFLDTPFAKSLNLRKISEKFVYEGAKNGVKIASKTSTIFKPNSKQPERLNPKSSNNVFNLNYNEEQLIIQETIQQFAQKMRVDAEKTDEAGKISDDLWQSYHELQLPYMQTPERLGGIMQEKSTVTQMLIIENLAHGDLGMTYAFYTSNSVLNAIVEFGTNAQQEELVPKFLSDTPMIATIAVNEPTPLFSPFELSTKATKKEENYILNGIKNMVPLGKQAEYILVAAQDENNSIKIFIVATNQNGLTVNTDKCMGLNSAELCTVKLDNVVVHVSAILGDDSFNYDKFITYSRLGWCALAVGCCQAVLDYVIPYANDRYAFGEPISNRQAVAFMIADMKIELDSMRILLQRAVALAEQDKDFTKQAYLAYILCTEKSMQIGTNGVQLLGGHGYVRDFPVERWYRDLRAVAICINGLHI